MVTLNDFLAAIIAEPDQDTPRLAFADWLDEHHPATPVRVGHLPVGFNRFWSDRGLSRWFGLNMPGLLRGRPANWEIETALLNHTVHSCRWFDHGGATDVAGVPVLVAEPYVGERDALPLCWQLQQLFKCPVSYSRRAAWHPTATRIGVWYQPPRA